MSDVRTPSFLLRPLDDVEGEVWRVLIRLMVHMPVTDDGRASLGVLTALGRSRLEETWPAHLAGVRALVVDRIAREDLGDFQRVGADLLAGIEANDRG